MLKITLAVLVSLTLGAAVLSAAAEGTVKAEVLTIRAKPDTQGAKVGSLKKGDQVTILEPASGWYRIALPADTDLWIAASLVKDGKVTASVANLRHAPSASGVILGKAKRDTAVEVLEGSTDEWLKIKCPAGVTLSGYVSAQYVESDVKAGTPNPAGGNTAATGKPGNASKDAEAIYAKLKPYLKDAAGREVTINGYIAPLKEKEPTFGFTYSVWEDKGKNKDLAYMGLIFAAEDLKAYEGRKVSVRATQFRLNAEGWQPVYRVIKVTEAR